MDIFSNNLKVSLLKQLNVKILRRKIQIKSVEVLLNVVKSHKWVICDNAMYSLYTDLLAINLF